MNDAVIVSKYLNHIKYKNHLLEFIEKDDGIPYDDKNDIIFKTDYFNKKFFIDEDTDNIFKVEFTNHLKNAFKDYYYEKLNVQQIWYQVYDTNNIHNWHTHSDCHFTNVYILKGNTKTEIKNLKGDIINYDIEEGYIITFPSYLYHRSPFHNSSDKRIIISFNAVYD